MKRSFMAAAFAACFCLPAHAAPDPGLRGSVAVCDPNAPQNCVAPSSAGVAPVSDPNNASYSRTIVMSVGAAAVAATRGLAADCAGGGVLTLTLSGAGSGSLTWTVAVGHQNQPYSITGISASTATCSYYGLY
jgi:hypothetical protein